MQVDIRVDGEVTSEVALDLNALADMLTDEIGVSVCKEKLPARAGTKDGGLVVALTMAGVALAAANTVVNVLNLWRSSRNRYSVSIKTKDLQVALSGMSSDALRDLLAKVQATDPSLNFLISSQD